ncbi:LysR family transcriptional regulator [Trinickia mobilis]|uniref:LysR family transcriptional regulator n=1 Tax=Trinickia mobilis TaxID=2816356 RepID=UPI001A8FC42E|nr:LysR family transcriptional regulator [Trinickia mobilis]
MTKLDFSERDLRSLRIFCAVARAGGFAAAEHQLNMSKASISRHIREVEERLGVRLCDRGPAGFELTTAGHVALEVASKALKSLECIKPEIDAVRGVLSGTLVIGMVEQIVTHEGCRIPEALTELKRRAPNIRPEINVMTFSQLNQALRERSVEVVIRGMYKKERAFNYLPLFVEVQRVYSMAHLVGEKTSSPVTLVYRPHPFVEDTLTLDGFERGPDATGLEAIALLISTGHYAGLLPEHYADLVTHRYPLKVIPGTPVYRNEICAITEASRPMTRNVELFLEVLRDLAEPKRGTRR